MKIIFAFLVLSFSCVSYAAKKGECSNFAEGAAIAKYHAQTGDIQGSDGIDHWSRLESEDPISYTYAVSIADNNEDGDTWVVEYLVEIEKDSCKVVSVGDSKTVESSSSDEE